MIPRIPDNISRKIGMIKAHGVKINVIYDTVDRHWNISIGNERSSTPSTKNEENLDTYVSFKLKELR